MLRDATPASLVLLDELGRGTATHDGVAVASAVFGAVVRDARCVALLSTQTLVLLLQRLNDTQRPARLAVLAPIVSVY